MRRVGAIEVGGTKTVAAIVSEFGEVVARTQVKTTTPPEVFQQVSQFLQRHDPKTRPIQAIGVGQFGPVDIQPASSNYGSVLATPKPGWAGANVIAELRQTFTVPIAVDTDVNAALLAEVEWGAGRGFSDVVYITVGTGIGGGILSSGRLVNGPLHPELGHMRAPSLAEERAEFAGVCPFHGSRCFEGVAAGPAIKARWGVAGEALAPDHPAWELEAEYLAALCHNIAMIFSPQRFVLGGGVMQQQHLHRKIESRLVRSLAQYLFLDAVQDDQGPWVVPPQLGADAGVLGASLLANRVAR
ncbi:MAG: ROK family protein [Pseudomonadota bacterium]